VRASQAPDAPVSRTTAMVRVTPIRLPTLTKRASSITGINVNIKNSFNNKKVGLFNLTCTDVDCSEGNSPLIQEYSVDGYPTVILKKDGERIDYDASISEENLQQFITQFLENN
jgi:hypothetical protein